MNWARRFSSLQRIYQTLCPATIMCSCHLAAPCDTIPLPSQMIWFRGLSMFSLQPKSFNRDGIHYVPEMAKTDRLCKCLICLNKSFVHNANLRFMEHSWNRENLHQYIKTFMWATSLCIIVYRSKERHTRFKIQQTVNIKYLTVRQFALSSFQENLRTVLPLMNWISSLLGLLGLERSCLRLFFNMVPNTSSSLVHM